jgi:hypothetical protein
MAFYILVTKKSEASDRVSYWYEETDGQRGWFTLRLPDGELLESTLAPGDDSRLRLARAVRKAQVAITSGAVPEKLLWAS